MDRYSPLKSLAPAIAGLCLSGLGVALAPPGAMAQTTPPGSTGTGPTGAGIPNTSPSEQQPGQGVSSLSQEDRRFALEAMQGNVAEVQAGNLAAEKATDPAVKEFARRMADDHGTAVQQLGALLGTQGGDMPKAGGPEDQKGLEKLRGLSGAEFDRAYMAHMAKAHDRDVRLYEEHASKANDSRLRLYITKTLPVLQQHQKDANALAGRLGKDKSSP